MKVRPLELDQDDACSRWDRFCMESDEAWFWHSSGWLRYQRAYRPELASVDRSFLLEEGRRVLAVCPLFEERRDGVVELGAGGSAAPAPALAVGLDASARESVAEAVFAELDQVASRSGAVRASLRCSPLAPAFAVSAQLGNPLLARGFLDVSLRTQLIDLVAPEPELFRALRENHRRNVKKACRELTVAVCDAAAFDEGAFAEYRRLHAKASGRATRPEQTFALMRDWLRRGDGMLVGARRGPGFVGFALLIVWKAGAYYASGANDPEQEEALGIAHLLHWEAIRALKARGVSQYEIGWQQAPLPHDLPSDKESAIAHFKRGFGGRAVPLFAGEKFYSAAYYREMAERRTRAYAAFLERR